MSTKALRLMRLVAYGAVALCALSSGCAWMEPDRPAATLPAAPAAQPATAAQATPATVAPAPIAVASVNPVRIEGRGPAAAGVANAFGEFPGGAARPAASAIENAFQQHTACDDGADADVAVDPTGKWLTFSSTRHSEHADIYLQRVGGSSVIQLTGDPADDVQPAFSPDGRRIAFCSNRSGNWEIYITDLDGKNVQQLTTTAGQEMHPSFSPDGTRLAYCALSPRNDQWELWVLDVRSGEKRMIGQGLFPTWSPRKDVDRIAFQRARQRGSRWFSVWTLDLVDGEPVRLTEVAASANAAVISPTWSPDGSKLAFVTVLSPAGPAEAARARQDVWVAAAEGGGRQRVTDGTGTNLSPTWGVDNRIYFISNRGGSENIWSARVEGGKALAADAAVGFGASGQHAANEKDQDKAAPAGAAPEGVSAEAANTPAADGAEKIVPAIPAPEPKTADTHEAGH